MKYKFVYVDSKIHPDINERFKEWFLMLDGVCSLMPFFEIQSVRNVKLYWGMKSSREYQYANNISGPIRDHATREQMAIGLMLANAKGRNSIVDDVNVLYDKVQKPMLKEVLEGKIILVNRNFGWRWFDEKHDMKILKTIEKDEYIFPETAKEDIKISKWPVGTHWYAKIGEHDIYDNKGNMKWDTYDEAKKWADRYMNSAKD